MLFVANNIPKALSKSAIQIFKLNSYYFLQLNRTLRVAIFFTFSKGMLNRYSNASKFMIIVSSAMPIGSPIGLFFFRIMSYFLTVYLILRYMIHDTQHDTFARIKQHSSFLLS